MHAVGVVHQHQKTFAGHARQGGKTVNDGIGVGDTGWVGMLRHVPDAFDERIVSDKRLDSIHIRPVIEQRHIDHLDAKRFGEGEVAIIARYWTEEFDGIIATYGLPRRAAIDSKMMREVQQVVHQGQARVVPRDDIRSIDIEQPSAKFARFKQAFERAVVSGVYAIDRIAAFLQQPVHRIRDVELLRSRFAAREVEGEAERLQRAMLVA